MSIPTPLPSRVCGTNIVDRMTIRSFASAMILKDGMGDNLIQSAEIEMIYGVFGTIY
jgi:hypothetical protein